MVKFLQLKKLNRKSLHADNHKRCCLLCLKKPLKYVEVNNDVLAKVNSKTGFDVQNDRLPSIVCSTCYKKLYETGNHSLRTLDYCKF